MNKAWLSLVVAGAVLLFGQSSVTAQQVAEFSPRAYCQATNGTVSETGKSAIYICCYRDKQKCVLSNVVRGYSRIIPLERTRLQRTRDPAVREQ